MFSIKDMTVVAGERCAVTSGPARLMPVSRSTVAILKDSFLLCLFMVQSVSEFCLALEELAQKYVKEETHTNINL